MSNNRLNIVFEDDHLIAVNKPSGWISVPGRNAENVSCVLTKLQSSQPTLLPVHRIDKETSGTLLMAKTSEAHKAMNTLFMNRLVGKEYQALVHGDLNQTTEVVNFLSPGVSGKIKVSKKGKKAESIFIPEARFGSWTWCTVRITTGRTHQIRVHGAHLGHPLVGDILYGGQTLSIHDIKSSARPDESSRPLINRTALHALKLSFKHPIYKEVVEIESPLPKDLKASLNQLHKWKRPIAN